MTLSHDTTALPVIIEGPTVRHTFIIRDARYRVWTKNGWRNGVCAALAKEWFDFKKAWIVADKLKRQIEKAEKSR